MGTSVTATYVFTDLVDSTATAARLGPEAAEELRQVHFRLLRGAVTASGGTEVKNLGDGLMVMYSSPNRALAGAVGMQQAVEHHNRSAPEPLGVRIGISAGEAVEEDGDYFGDPVVEAARLCAVAEGGQILAADIVRALVGRHATQTFTDRGALQLKGLPEPVETVAVVWEPMAVAGSVPLPGRLIGAATDSLFGFFGRAGELEAFDELRKRAESGRRCQVVFVAGEAGLGKTALVAQAARAAHADGAVVVFGHADEDLGVAYRPWIEIASSLVRDAAPEAVAALRSAQRGALGRLVPEIAAGADRVGDPDTERLLLVEGMIELVAAASVGHPVFIVLDDLHWADAASLGVLRQLIVSPTPMGVTIACTYRDTDLGRSDPLTSLLSDLHREVNVTRVALEGLEDTDLVELLTAAAGHDLDDAGVGLAHALRRETDGNPFFTGELLRHLGESGGIVLGGDGRWTVAGELAELGLPNSVRDVVGRRAGRLGDEAIRVLSVAAVIGREFDVDLLGAVAQVDEDQLLDLMDASVAAALLVESDVAGHYRFAHALIQHSLYHELSPTRRQRAHQRIAEALETDDTGEDAAVLAELARHWVAATRPAELDRALGYVQRAGDAALAALAPDDAIGWYQQALDLLTQRGTPDDGRRARLLAALGTAQHQAGRPEHRDNLLAAAAIAEQRDDVDTLVRAALGFHTVVGYAANEEARHMTAAALDRIGPEPSPARARLLAALSRTYDRSEDWRTVRDLGLEALDAARRSADPATFAQVFDATVTYLGPDRVAGMLDDVDGLVAWADRSGDPLMQARAQFHRVWACLHRYDLTGAKAANAEMEVVVERIGLPHERWRHALVVTGLLLLAGDADAAEAANERTLELGTAAALPEIHGIYGGVLANVRRHQGRLDELLDFFLDVARDNPSLSVLRAAIASMLCSAGRVDEARERLSVEAADDFDLPDDSSWTTSMAELLDAAATTRSLDAARTLVDRVAPYATQVVAPSGVLFVGALARPLARAATVLGEHDRAEEWFATAHDIHDRLRAPYWKACGQLDHAELCLARRADGDSLRARRLITDAAATAAQFGCIGLTRRAEALFTTL